MNRNLPCPFWAELASSFAIILEEPASKGKAQQRTSASNHSKKNQIQHMYGYQKNKLKKSNFV